MECKLHFEKFCKTVASSPLGYSNTNGLDTMEKAALFPCCYEFGEGPVSAVA
jgi:hypothetical protein